MDKYLPKGMSVVTPYFMIENANAFIDFLRKAFGATIEYLTKTNEGYIMHARIAIEGCVIELSEAKPPQYPALQFACQLFVPDCDAVYKKALEYGATSNGEPSDQPYGLRAGYITDAWGNQWFISTQINNGYSPDEWARMNM